MIALALWLACPEDDTDDLTCGRGTHQEGNECVADESDADTDTDTDTDADTDADADTDTDADTDADTDVIAGSRWSGSETLPGEGWAITGERANDGLGHRVVAGDADGDGVGDLVVSAPYAYRGNQYAGTACFVRGPITGDVSAGTDAACIDGPDEYARLGEAAAFAGDLDGDGVRELAVAAPYAGAGEHPLGAGTIYVFSGFPADVGDAAAVWHGDAAEEGAGAMLAGGTDFTGDGAVDLLTTSRWNNLGAVYLLGTHAMDGGSLADDADARIVPVADRTGGFGTVVLDLGDVDGDGVHDLGAGWSGYDHSGALAIFLGPVASGAAEDADAFVTGQSGEFVSFPTGTVSAGDVDGDGHDDILLGNPVVYGMEPSYCGVAHLVSGATAAGGTSVLFAAATFEGDRENEGLGRSVSSLGDQDLDGHADIVLGAPGDGTEAQYGGAVFAYYGPLSGHYDRSEASATWNGTAYNQSIGSALAGGRDLTGDGVLDLAIGAEGDGEAAEYAGAVFVIPGLLP